MNVNRASIRLATACAGTLLMLSAGPSAYASSDTAAAGDLRSLCPAIDTQLEDALGAVWHRVGEPSTLRVQLRVSGREVAVERVSGWPLEYRQAVTRAAWRLACDAGPGSDQRLSFEVSFVGPDAVPGAPARLARR